MGVFDGAGHTISGMTAADEYNCGLFMSLQDAQIFDLTVTGSIRSSGEQGHTGGIAGSSSKSRITNCHFICEQDGSAGGANRSFVGGIVGFSSESSLEGCTAAGSFVGGDSSFVGGIVGFDSTTNEAPDIGTRNCAAECDISAGEGSEAHRVADKAGILSNNTANADTRINGAVIDPADEKYGADRLHGATLQS